MLRADDRLRRRSSRSSASTSRPRCTSRGFMLFQGKYKWLPTLLVEHRRARGDLRAVRNLVPGAAAQGTRRAPARLLEPARNRTHDRGRHRQPDAGLRRRADLEESAVHAGRHPARGADRRAAGPRRRQRRGDPAAAHVHDAADVGDHHAVVHLLGRVVRRRDHVDPVQHTGRAMVGRDDLRRLSDGAAGPRRRGADRRVHVVVRRRAVRDPADHVPGAAGRQVRAASSGRPSTSRSSS